MPRIDYDSFRTKSWPERVALLSDISAEERVELVLAQVKGPLRDRMRRSGLMDRLGEDHIYRTVTEAVSAWQAGHDRGPEHGPASD